MKITLVPVLLALICIGVPTALGQTCECDELCTQCQADGSNTADCQTVCDIAADPSTCVEQCDATLNTGGDVGELEPTETSAGEPNPTTETPVVETDPTSTETPVEEVDPAESSACECVELCTQCGGAGTADCQTVCNIAADAATCVEQCDATLHIGDTEATDPETSKGYSQKIGMAVIVGAIVVAVA